MTLHPCASKYTGHARRVSSAPAKSLPRDSIRRVRGITSYLRHLIARQLESLDGALEQHQHQQQGEKLSGALVSSPGIIKQYARSRPAQ